MQLSATKKCYVQTQAIQKPTTWKNSGDRPWFAHAKNDIVAALLSIGSLITYLKQERALNNIYESSSFAYCWCNPYQASAFYYSLEASQKLFDTSYTLDIYTDKNQKACTYGLSYLTMDKEFVFSGLYNDIFNVVYPECRLLVDNWQPRSITMEECTYSCILTNSVANEYFTYQC